MWNNLQKLMLLLGAVEQAGVNVLIASPRKVSAAHVWAHVATNVAKCDFAEAGYQTSDIAEVGGGAYHSSLWARGAGRPG